MPKLWKGAYMKEYLRIHTSLLFNPKIMKKKIIILRRGHFNVQDGLDYNSQMLKDIHVCFL